MSDDGGSRKVMSRRWRKRGHGKKSSEAIAPEGGKTDTVDVLGSRHASGEVGIMRHFTAYGGIAVNVSQSSTPCRA